MSETELTEALPQEASKLPEFKSVCMRLGLMMIVIFISRVAGTVVTSLCADLTQDMDITAAYAIRSLLSFVFLYIIPITAAMFILKQPRDGMCSRVYGKPVYFGSAMGMFPAIYGVAIMINLLTMWVSSWFEEADLNKSFNTVNELRPDNIPCALILFAQLVVIAPLFEEFWFRGIVMESLRPFGNGFAIFVSALLFGMTHANFQQFFYAFAIGIALGYIAISTKSIITTMIMHAMFNSISGIMLLLLAFPSVGDYLMNTMRGKAVEPEGVVWVYLVFVLFMMLLMFVGVLMAIWKLRKIKKYKVPKVWTEVSTPRRWGIFFSRVTVIVMLVLAADTFTFRYIPYFIYHLISG